MKAKRFLALILSLCMMLTIAQFPVMAGVPDGYTEPPIVNSAYVKARLEQLRDKLEGKFFTVDGTSCGKRGDSACTLKHDKAHIATIIAGEWFKGKFPELSNLNVDQITSQFYEDGKGWKGYHCFGFANFVSWYVNSVNTTDYMMESKLIYSGTYSGNAIKNNCAVGDIVRCNGHSAVIYSMGESSYQVIECNFTVDGTYEPSMVRVRTINYSSNRYFDGNHLYVTRTANYEPDSIFYDRDAAADWANENWNSNTQSKQCANFASYCLKTGGIPMESNKAVTVDLRDFLVNNGYATQIKLSNKNYTEGVLEKGDVIYIECNDYDSSGNLLKTHYPHVYVCDGKNSSGVATASAWSSNRNKSTGWWWLESQWTTNSDGHHTSTSSVKYAFYSLHINSSISSGETIEPSTPSEPTTPSAPTTPSTKKQYRYGRWEPVGYSWAHFCPELGAERAIANNEAWKGQPWKVAYYNQSTNDGWIDTKYAPVETGVYSCGNASHDHTVNGKTYYTMSGSVYTWDKYTVGAKTYYWREERTVCVVHDYSNDCDTTCNRSGCGATRTVAGHKYDNACDTTCNICGATRTITHTYKNACDTVCDVCGATRTFYGHKYDNDCDTSCNICGKTRTITHTYSNDCDTSCNVCGVTRTTTHTYDNSSDATCNVCGATRNIAVTSVSLNKTAATLNVGETLTLTATITPSTATNKTVSWSSNNTSVATVSNSTVTAKSAGTAVITVKTADGNKTATCTITVKSPILASGTCGDNVTWSLSDKGKLTLSGSGATYDYSSTLDVPWYSHRTSIKTIEITGTVTRIGNTLFGGLPNVTSITIPSSVASIGSYGISNCDSLASLTVPNSVTSIGASAFYGCDVLTYVKLPAGIAKISGYMFNGCTAIESIEIPESVTSIGEYAFYGCSSLKYISVPNAVVKVEEGTFRECTSLEEIVIPDSVIEIETGAFNGCTSLAEITIPKNVATIGNYAFQECSSLTNVYYKGTKSDKTEMSVGNINNGALTGATWCYVLCKENGHTYDNACDTSCNVCEETRTTTHTYTNACDTSCNVCGTTRTVGDHIYDNDTDTTCNECGFVREIILQEAPTFVVENKTAKAGDTFTVDVSIKNNSGIIGLRTYVGYDSDVLELVSATAGEDFSDTSFGPTNKNPFSILWDDSLASSNNTTNGVVATLTFKVKEGVEACETEITLTYDPEDVYDFNWDNVEFGIENGTITVIEYISGDVNGDGNVNNKDLGVLRRWLNDWDVEIDELAADVNRDGKVNNKDLGILRRYLNDWDIELK